MKLLFVYMTPDSPPEWPLSHALHPSVKLLNQSNASTVTPSADHVKPLKNWRSLFFLQQLPSCASGDFVTVYQTGYPYVFLWGCVYLCVGPRWSHHLWEWNLTNSVCRSQSKWKCGDDHEAWPHAVTINLLKRTTTKTEIFVVCVLVIITSVLGVCAAPLSAAGEK